MADEIYDQLVFDGAEMATALDFPAIRERLIILNGWSKNLCHDRVAVGVWDLAARSHGGG